MGAICQNCKTTLSCGCQKRQASNGVTVCSICLTKYEAGLLQAKQLKSPTNVTVLYNAARK